MNIQIFLTTHNRPECIVEAIDSILYQSYKNIELVISDNSDNFLTKNLLEEIGYLANERIRYIKRKCIPPIDHFNEILKEVESEYFMIFHDDDIMMPDMVQYLYQLLTVAYDQSAIAAGCNAFIAKQNSKTKKLYIRNAKNKKENIVSENQCDLALMYINSNNCPFDSYLYKSIVARTIALDKNKGGKYCDLSFLLDVNSIGKLVIASKPLMYLRTHAGQDSKSHSLLDRITLLSYIKFKTLNSLPKIKVKDFQLFNIYAESCKRITGESRKITFRRLMTVVNLLIKHGKYSWLAKLLLRFIASGARKMKIA